MAIAARGVCPECGADPVAGRIAPPRWARWSGLPLALAGVALVLLALGGMRQEQSTHTGIARSACEPWVEPSLRVGEIRAAAAGDEAKAWEVVQLALEMARQDPIALRTSRLAAAAFDGPGWHSQQLRFGWPLRWLSMGRTTHREDITRKPPPAVPTDSDMRSWNWLRWEPGIDYVWSRGNEHLGVRISLGAAAAILLLLVCLATAGREVGRRWGAQSRAKLRITLVVFAGVAVLMPTWRERSMVAWPRLTAPRPMLAEVQALARTGPGAIAVSQQLASQLTSQADEHLVQFFWQLPIAMRETSSLGWPGPWISTATHTPTETIEADARLAQQRLTVLQDCMVWVRVDVSGQERRLTLNYTAIAAVLLPLLLLCVSPRLVWLAMARRRERRWRAQGRCLACGYQR